MYELYYNHMDPSILESLLYIYTLRSEYGHMLHDLANILHHQNNQCFYEHRKAHSHQNSCEYLFYVYLSGPQDQDVSYDK